MPRPKSTGRKKARPEVTEVTGKKSGTPHFDDADAFTIKEFCCRNRVSVPMFYKRRDLMPQTFYVGKHRLISREAAARWRREREAASAKAEHTT